MVSNIALTHGAILSMLADSSEISSKHKPVVQLLSVIRISENRQENCGETNVRKHNRLRATINDGAYVTSHVLLSTPVAKLYIDGDLIDNSVIRINAHNCRTTKHDPVRRVIIVQSIDIVNSGSEIGGRIGNPKLVNADGTITSLDQNLANMENTDGINLHHAKRKSFATPLSPRKESAHKGVKFETQVNLPIPEATISVPGCPMGSTYPVDSLNPYQQKWTIKARVTNKSTPRNFTNKNGVASKVFSVTLTDASGEIRASLFGGEADRFENVLNVGKIYYIGNAKLKPSNKDYAQGVTNDYEMTFTSDTTVISTVEDTSVPSAKYNFVDIDKLKSMEANTFVDVMAIVKTVHMPQKITTKAQKELTKRDVELIDSSSCSVVLTLWGDQAEDKDASLQQERVIAVRGARLSEFQGGKTLNAGFSGSIIFDPDMDEARSLTAWYSKQGLEAPVTPISHTNDYRGDRWKTLRQALVEKLGYGDQADYFTNLFFISNVNKERIVYESCPNQACAKKVVSVSEGVWRCERCNEEIHKVAYRLLPMLTISDSTGSVFVIAFEEQAAQILGKTGLEIGELLCDVGNGGPQIDRMVADVCFSQHVIRVRVKSEIWNDKQRLKYSIAAVTHVTEAEIAKRLVVHLDGSEVNS